MKRIGISLVMASVCATAYGQVDFSHDTGTLGVPGSAVDAGPNVGHIFSGAIGTNNLAADLASMGLVPGDNIDAFDRGDVGFTGSGVSAFPFLFSVESGAVGEAGYPVFFEAPFNGADVYAMESGVTGHLLAYNEPGLGLRTVANESIDGMTDSMVVPGQRVYFSLQQGSPTLLSNAWSGADILTVVIGAPGTLVRSFSAGDVGLIPADEIDGFAMYERTDGNGNGVFDDSSDSALVYFSVDETSVGVPGSDVRQRSLLPLFHGGDIYTSGVAGNHVILHKAEQSIRLGAGDVLDALKLGSSDQTDLFPMRRAGGQDPLREPVKPVSCPPYRGTGVPIGSFWVLICDTPLAAITNWEMVIKMCDPNGNQIKFVYTGPTTRGAVNANPKTKAQMIEDAFKGIMFDKPGHDPDSVNLFVEMGIQIPPTHVPPGQTNITASVCGLVNQEVIDCGWNVDLICLSFSNWTAKIPVKPVLGWFPDVKRQPLVAVEGIAEEMGLLRITSIGSFNDDADVREFSVLVFPGDDGLLALHQLSDEINSKGGVTHVSADGVMVIDSLPNDMPVDDDGVSGPYVIEAGANGVPGLNITVGAALARGPGSPCTAVDYAKPYGQLDFFDVSAFLAKFADQAGDADLSWDGEFNFFDISTFLQLYTQGCPDSDG